MIESIRTTVTEKQFTIDAPQQRVWKLLGSSIFQCLPLEEMHAPNQTTFYAILRWRLRFTSIPLNLKGKLVDIVEPSSLGAIIWVKRGVVNLGMKITFILRPVNEGKTEVVCSATEESRGIIVRIMRRWGRIFAENAFSSIQARLEQIC
ncbi:hypothetical protein ACFLV0_04200 [Chloroflexota bacterium]